MAKILGVSGGTLFMVSVGEGDALEERSVPLALVLDITRRKFVSAEALPARALAGRGYWEAPESVSEAMLAEASRIADEQLHLREVDDAARNPGLVKHRA